MRITPSGWEDKFARALREVGWVCHQPGQSCIGNNHAYKGKTDTSQKAALNVLPRTGTGRARVYERLLDSPATDLELQHALSMIGDTERPRRGELVDGGFVRDSGMRKKHDGEEWIVWEVVR